MSALLIFMSAYKNSGGLIGFVRKARGIYSREGVAGLRLRVRNAQIFRAGMLASRKRVGRHSATGGRLANVIDIDRAPVLARSPGSIAIHIHLFYADLADEFVSYLSNMPFDFDLYISVTDENNKNFCAKKFAGLRKAANIRIEVVQNRGRDIAPMLCTFGERLAQYDYVAHIHGKKSLYNSGATDGWREYLLESLFGNTTQIQKIFSLLSAQNYGIVYPQTFHRVPYQAHTWLANRGLAQHFCPRFGLSSIPQSFFDFPVGSMFWAKVSALKPLFAANLQVDEFPLENRQKDGTLAHVIERMLGVIPNALGYPMAVLRDTKFPSPSAWRLEQYFIKGMGHVTQLIDNPGIKLIIFDVFDTLVMRPLIEPDHTKKIVARQISLEQSTAWLELRGSAENIARHRAGRDIDLDAIYREIEPLWLSRGLSVVHLSHIKELEIEIELRSIKARAEALQIFDYAVRSGKQVVLASDMFLPRARLEPALRALGISGYAEFYLSSEKGMRKDSGELYDIILKSQQCIEQEVLVFGDNERSDFQIPSDRGMHTFHLLRPIEIARSTARLNTVINNLIERPDIDAELSAGLIVQKYFKPVFYERFDVGSGPMQNEAEGVGYSVAGPLAASFAAWLVRRSRELGIKKLFFLAREGQVLKAVYDIWSASLEGVPISEYLVVSRRAMSVAMISGIEDIYSIARATYFKNCIESFFINRFGLELDKSEWIQLVSDGLAPKKMQVEIVGGNIDSIKPLLNVLSERIFAISKKERPGLEAYLRSKGVYADEASAVVDVGYSGTIQKYLCVCTEKPIHGFYMATMAAASAMANFYDVTADGCFVNGARADDASLLALIRNSFELEKLLSSNDPQVLSYMYSIEKGLEGNFRLLSEREENSAGTRLEIQRGIFGYVADCVEIREKYLPDFRPSTEIGESLFNLLTTSASPSELEIFAKVSLDDYYCGRGVVS